MKRFNGKYRCFYRDFSGIHLVDKCLIVFMVVLLAQSAYSLIAGEAWAARSSDVDVIVRTSAASIFGYFLSANFINRSSGETGQRRGESPEGIRQRGESPESMRQRGESPEEMRLRGSSLEAVQHSADLPEGEPLAPESAPDCANGGEPDFASGGEPDFASGCEPDFTSGGEPDFASGSEPDFAISSEPDFTSGSEPDFASVSEPDFTSGSEPDFAISSEPDFASGGDPDCAPLPDRDAEVRLQILVAAGIGLFCLAALILLRNIGGYGEDGLPVTAAATVTQFRDFVSGCVGFLIGCPTSRAN